MAHEAAFMIAKVSKGQQITLPASIRASLDLKAGCLVDIEQEEGKIVIIPIGERLDTLFEKAKRIKPKHRLTPSQMDSLNERLFR